MENQIKGGKCVEKDTNTRPRSIESNVQTASRNQVNDGEVDSQLILQNMDVDLGNFMTSDSVNTKDSGGVECTVDVMETPWVGREEEEIPNKVLPTHNPQPDEHYCVDLMDHFNKVFEKRTFNSFKEFDELFSQFKKETGSVFRIKSSCSVAYENSRRKQHFIPTRFKFVSIKYCCVHYGQPKVSGQGIRTKQRYLPCGCGCVLSVAYNRGALFISQVNMRHNHEVSNKIAPYYAINRRITKHELRQVADVVAVMPSSRALQYFLKERFHRPMTLQDAKNTRARLKTMQMKQAQTESLKVAPSIKAIPQIHNEHDGRTILEIKEESTEVKPFEEDDEEDYYHPEELKDMQQEDKSELAMKSKAVSEIVAKFSDLMNSCDTSVFWERISVMNEVMECWENGENLDIHYTTEYAGDTLDLGSSKKETKCMQGRPPLQRNLRIPQDRPNVSDQNCNIAQQDVSDRQMKFLLPVVNGTMQFAPASINGSSVKLNLSQVESKPVNKSDDIIKRPRGRPRKKDSLCSQLKPKEEVSECVTYQNKCQFSDVGQVKDDNYSNQNESRLSVNNLNNSSDFYCGPPFISCITKEPCMDISEQALEVEIEINDDNIP